MARPFVAGRGAFMGAAEGEAEAKRVPATVRCERRGFVGVFQSGRMNASRTRASVRADCHERDVIPGDLRNSIGNPRRPYPSGTSIAWISSSSTRGPKRQRAQGVSPRHTGQSSRNLHNEPQRGQPVIRTMVASSYVASGYVASGNAAAALKSLRAMTGLDSALRLARPAASLSATPPLPRSRRPASPSWVVLPSAPLPSAISTRHGGEESVKIACGEPRKRLQEEQRLAARYTRLDLGNVSFSDSRPGKDGTAHR